MGAIFALALRIDIIMTSCSLLLMFSFVASTSEALLLPTPLALRSRISNSLPFSQSGKAMRVAAAAAAIAASEENIQPLVGDPRPGPLSVSIGGKALNIPGVMFALSMTAWVVILYPLVLACAVVSFVFDEKKRRAMDFMVSLWAKLSMLTCGYRPTLVGAEELPPRGEAVVYVPNHCSYLDILTLSGYLPRSFKYISKIEILRIPLIGWAMAFAGHVALRRSDRRSQLESYKNSVESLKNGNSLVAFAEGTRAVDGRLQTFKRGPFKMAIDSGVDVIPVAIRDLHRWHPTSALMPLGRPRGVELKILPRVVTLGKTPEQALTECYDAVNAALPPHQRAPTKKTN